MRRVIIGLGAITISMIFTGCAPKIPQLPKVQEVNQSKPQKVMWEDTSTKESNYHLKPEPYSLDSKQKDPELLGPQSTLKQPLDTAAEEHAEDEEPQFLAKDEDNSRQNQNSASLGMTKSKCIDLIGESKFNAYTRQFGSESAALRKCAIIERVQQNQ